MIRVISQDGIDFLETAGRTGQILADAKDFGLSFVKQVFGFACSRVHGVINNVVARRN